MIDVRRAAERYPGGDPAAGIETRHAFSFGPHYDPDNLRFGPLIACNEERLAPGAGFDEHPHSHTEIVTWVIEGELTHRDSAGHERTVRAGDVQHLSAAAGVRHVERNDGEGPLAFLQMWLAPLEPGGEPSYDIVPGIADATPTPSRPRAPCCMCAAWARGADRRTGRGVPVRPCRTRRGAAGGRGAGRGGRGPNHRRAGPCRGRGDARRAAGLGAVRLTAHCSSSLAGSALRQTVRSTVM